MCAKLTSTHILTLDSARGGIPADFARRASPPTDGISKKSCQAAAFQLVEKVGLNKEVRTSKAAARERDPSKAARLCGCGGFAQIQP